MEDEKENDRKRGRPPLTIQSPGKWLAKENNSNKVGHNLKEIHHEEEQEEQKVVSSAA